MAFYGVSHNEHYEMDLKDVPLISKILLVLTAVSLILGMVLFDNTALFLILLGLCFILFTLSMMTAYKIYKNSVLWIFIIIGLIVSIIGLLKKYDERIFIIFLSILGVTLFPIIGIIILIYGYRNKYNNNNKGICVKGIIKEESDAKCVAYTYNGIEYKNITDSTIKNNKKINVYIKEDDPDNFYIDDDGKFYISFGWFWLIFSLIMDFGMLILISAIVNQSFFDTIKNFIYLF